jgi:class 3 adenylate cyclase
MPSCQQQTEYSISVVETARLEIGHGAPSENIPDAHDEAASSCSKVSFSDHHRRSQQSEDGKDGAENLVRTEARAVRIVRGILIILLAVAAALTGVFTYRLTSRTHIESFIRDFEDVATRSVRAFNERLGNYVFQASSLSLAMSTGLYTGAKPNLPDVSIADLDDLTWSLRLQAGAVDIVWSPFLKNEEDKSRWEAYAISTQSISNTNSSGQNGFCNLCGDGYEIVNPDATILSSDGVTEVLCSAAVQAAEAGFLPAAECTIARPYIAKACGCQVAPTPNVTAGEQKWKVSDGIFRLDNGTAVLDDTPGPASPVWQISPSTSGQNAIMFNQMSEPHRRNAIYSMLRSKLPVISETILSSNDSFYQLANVPASTGGVHAMLFYPVFESTQSQQIVGSLAVDFSWNLLLGYDLSERSDGLIIVMESTCGQVYTFKVVGNAVELLGEGDLHDTTFDSLAVSLNFSDFQGILIAAAPKQSRFVLIPPGKGGCAYLIKVYPSNEFRERYHSNEPWQITLVVVLIFVFTSLLFLLYDFIVRRIQEKVLSSAKRSEAIVSSLFPAVVRERLFRDGSNQTGAQDSSGSTALTDTRRGQFGHGLMNHKARLKSYLTHPPSLDMCRDLEPIADLFPNTTILFADIAGFTAWSSEREPSKVFKLLETLYGAFDQVAKKLGVFKVETIGDCYVAVSGLPEPRKDHAVVMVKFAYECMALMNDLTRQLESSLGPGTADLAIRVGLHSGPVIAGVLRGERARFQLFGDTMNVASRMESTGKISQIHVSKDTAEILMKAGKSEWVEPRTELVEVKGKGQLQTYWVKPLKRLKRSSSEQSACQTTDECQSIRRDSTNNQDASVWGATNLDTALALRASPSDRHHRLIEWNAELLQQFLQKIIARRNASSNRRARRRRSHLQNSSFSGQEELNIHVVDEIAEVIQMPDFDERVAKEETDPSLIDLGSAVRSQIWTFVFHIAGLYRDNAFHNFEHASHVAMSASKLLKRIIAPDDVEYRASSSSKKLKSRKILSKEIHESTFGISSDPLLQFAVVFSALIHDVDHTGLPNRQLVQSNDPLAIKYQNKSVAEQHSVRLAWKILMEDQNADFRRCIYHTEEEHERFRQLVINAVIATDIADKELQAWRKRRWEKAFHEEMRGRSIQSQDKTSIDRKATTVFAYIIQASDVAHTMQHWHIYQKWNRRLFNEQYTAFIEGKETENPSLSWFQGELDFFDHYVIPLAKNLEECNVFGVSCDEYLSYALENRHEWSLKGEQIVVEMIAACSQKL